MNVKRVADFWCGGDGEKAMALPRSTFNEILATCLAQEQGRAIEEEEAAKARARADRARKMRGG